MAQRKPDGHMSDSGIAKYSPSWNRAQEHEVSAQAALDKTHDLLNLEELKASIRKPIAISKYTPATATILVNMWRINVSEQHTRVHVFVFDFDRLNPKNSNVLKLKKDQKYAPEDVKNFMATTISSLLKALKRPDGDHVFICGDGEELLIVNADKFSVADIMQINILPGVTVQTGVDSFPSMYKATVGLAGSDVLLLPEDMSKPLTLNGANGHGLVLTSLKIFSAIVFWQPGHLDLAVGNAKEGWVAYNNKLMFNWGACISNYGWPSFTNDLHDERWMSQLPPKIKDLAKAMRPDMIDEFAPDARRELAKGISVQLVAGRDHNLYMRSDLWRPIAFTGVSRRNPIDLQPSAANGASLVEEYLHRMSSLFDSSNGGGQRQYTWEKLFGGKMPSAEMQANVANARIRSQLRRLPVYTVLSSDGAPQPYLTRRKIFKLHAQSADEHTFNYNGANVSVTDYYYQKYKIRLIHHATLPLVDVAVQKAKPTLIPMELCYIETHLCTAAQLLACHGRNEVPAEVTTAILKAAALPGDKRFGAAKQWTSYAGVGADKTSAAFNVKSDLKTDVNAVSIVVEPNQLIYDRNCMAPVNVEKGGWMTPRAPYLKPIAIGTKWFAVLHQSLTRAWDSEIKNPFLKELAITAARQGMPFDMCPEANMIAYDNEKDLVDSLTTQFARVGRDELRIIIVIMPSRSPKVYQTVKTWGDVTAGVPTQCILYPTIKKAFDRNRNRVNPDTLFNLLLKMNVKMGGANWTFGPSNDPLSAEMVKASRDTLYLGVDVRHPQPARCTKHILCAHTWHSPRNCPNLALAKMSPYGSSGNDDESPPPTEEEKRAAQEKAERRTPPGTKERRGSGNEPERGAPNNLEKAYSFAAITGNIVEDVSRVGCTIRVQTGGREELVHVTESLRDRIRKYMDGTKKPPRRIVYLRDGVGDDQAARMLQEEWHCLMDAIKQERLTNVYVVFLMAQKTHNLRMFDPKGERGNVRMGTVLTSQSGMTSEDMNDFYMVAHRALQGTAKPLRYVLLKHGWSDPAKTDPPPYEVTELSLIKELMPLHLMNARAQKACQLPSVVAFAHLGAERASVHIADRWGADNDPEGADRTVRIHTETEPRMYWM